MLETANIRLYQIGELKRLCCALVFVFRIDTKKVRFSENKTSPNLNLFVANDK